MEKNSPFFTATVASVFYFVIFIMLKYFLQNKTVDWQSALFGAVVFWLVIFIVHYFLDRRYGS
jgi:membrane associated rhomboid family serine protease